MNKTKKLIIYEAKKGKQLFLNATSCRGNKFVMRNPPYKYGKALPPSVTNAELGRQVRLVLKNCV